MTKRPPETRKAKTAAKKRGVKTRTVKTSQPNKTSQPKRAKKAAKVTASASPRVMVETAETRPHSKRRKLSAISLRKTTEHIAELTAITAPSSSISVSRTVITTATHIDVSDTLLPFDWSRDANNIPLGDGAQVSGNPNIYRINNGSLIVSTDSGAVNFRYCNESFDVNLPIDSPVLAALDPDGQLGVLVPINLTFQNPLSSVAAYVTVEGHQFPPGTPLHAVMWYQFAGTSAWLSASGSGVASDQSIPPGAPPTAPFVKVSGDGRKISKVRFDALLFKPYRFHKLVLSQLQWQP